MLFFMDVALKTISTKVNKKIHRFIRFHYYAAKKIQFLNFQDVVLQLIEKKTPQHVLLSLESLIF